MVLADVSEKALAQVKRGAVELLTPRMELSAAEALAAKLAGGHWTHDYALTASEAATLGLPVKVAMPNEEMELMKLYPQPIQQSGVEYLPIDIPRRPGIVKNSMMPQGLHTCRRLQPCLVRQLLRGASAVAEAPLASVQLTLNTPLGFDLRGLDQAFGGAACLNASHAFWFA